MGFDFFTSEAIDLQSVVTDLRVVVEEEYPVPVVTDLRAAVEEEYPTDLRAAVESMF